MSNSSLSSSPARSSVSTTALVAGTAAAAISSSSPLSADDYHFPTDLISMQDRKEEVCKVLKTDVMVALNKAVKSLDEDSWMFEGPRSRIHLISKPGGLQNQHLEIPKSHNIAAHK